MDAPRLNWLKARLDEQPDRPSMIFMHHPPFPTGLQHMDSINCRNAPAMAEILRGRPTSSASPAVTITADPDPLGRHDRQRVALGRPPGRARPKSARRRHLHHGAAGYHMHLWQPEAGLITHTAFIGQFSGPHPFLLDPDTPPSRTRTQHQRRTPRPDPPAVICDGGVSRAVDRRQPRRASSCAMASATRRLPSGE